MDGWTDRPTDLPTDTARCRVACPRLKMMPTIAFRITLFLDASVRNASLWEGLSIGLPVPWSVGPSISPFRQSVTPVRGPRFLADLGHGEILYWTSWSTDVFWEPPSLFCRFIFKKSINWVVSERCRSITLEITMIWSKDVNFAYCQKERFHITLWNVPSTFI